MTYIRERECLNCGRSIVARRTAGRPRLYCPSVDNPDCFRDRARKRKKRQRAEVVRPRRTRTVNATLNVADIESDSGLQIANPSPNTIADEDDLIDAIEAGEDDEAPAEVAPLAERMAEVERERQERVQDFLRRHADLLADGSELVTHRDDSLAIVSEDGEVLAHESFRPKTFYGP